MRLNFDYRNKELLKDYINKLIINDRLYQFYKSEEWIYLKDNVLHANHNECVHCRERHIITQADVVHHVNEVRKVPELALSFFYIDRQGRRCINLIPLCNACHEKVHDKLKEVHEQKKQEKFMNEERW